MRRGTHSFRVRVVGLGLLCLLPGCSVLPWKAASKPVEAQKGGYAQGAGASIVQPVNSGQASTQKATERRWYATGTRNPAASRNAPKAEVEHDLTDGPGVNVDAEAAEVPAVPAIPVYEEWTTETTLGAHQDLAGIVTAAGSLLKQTSMLLWFGLMATIGGAFGIAWSAGNERGYMVVSVLTLVIGITWVIVPPSNWWLLLGAIPFGSWLMQQDGVMKLVRRAAGIP